MRTIFKIIYFASIVFIATGCLLFILLKALPLEFKNSNNQDNFESFFAIGIPIAILLTLSRLGFKKNPEKAQTGRLILKTILISAGAFVLFIFYAFATFGLGLCAWSDRKTLFESSTDRSIKIVERDYGCGALDSGSPIVEIFKVREITPLFIYITKIDTAKIDKEKWTRVKEE